MKRFVGPVACRDSGSRLDSGRVVTKFWRVGRAVDGTCLENKRARKGPGGSNPSPSAKQQCARTGEALQVMMLFKRFNRNRKAAPEQAIHCWIKPFIFFDNTGLFWF